MKTTLQEFYEYIEQHQYFIGNDLYEKYQEMLKKEKEQMKKVYSKLYTPFDSDHIGDIDIDFELYYNETFNKDK